MPRTTLSLWLLLFAPVAALAQTAAAPTRAPGNETILRDQLEADLHFLAGDTMRGRLTASAEYRLTAEFIAARFRRLGLQPGSGADSFYHRFDLVLSRLAAPNRLQAGPREGKLLDDFYPLVFSANGRVAGAPVFAGHGIKAPALDWNDYAKAPALAGAIAVALDGDPDPDDPRSPFDGVVTSDYANPLRKALWAQEAGAAALLIVSNAPGAPRGTNPFPGVARNYWPVKPPHLEKYTLDIQARRIRIPVMQVSPAWADAILGPDRSKPTPIGRVELEVSLDRTIVEDRNVVARIDGADPKLKDEAVIVSAHYDHNGADGEQIFNGADDNGSGVVALLEIAEAYALAAARGVRPKRTVLFASWGSEERCCGPLLGAWAWVEEEDARHAWPVDRTVATLNMDMIGRSEEVPAQGGRRFNGLAPQTAGANANNVNILGWSYSPDLDRLVDEANYSSDLRLLKRYDNNKSQLLRRSDQWPFLQRRVPALFFHTGLHPDYHTTNDRPERIDFTKVERIARLVHQLSWNLADRDGRPAMPARRVIPQ